MAMSAQQGQRRHMSGKRSGDERGAFARFALRVESELRDLRRADGRRGKPRKPSAGK